MCSYYYFPSFFACDDSPGYIFEKGYHLFYKAYLTVPDPSLTKIPYELVEKKDLATIVAEDRKALRVFQWSHVPAGPPSTIFDLTREDLEYSLLALSLWMAFSDSVIILTPDALLPTYCPDTSCSSNKVCEPHFYCLMNLSIPKLDLANFSELEAEATDSRFRMCLAERYNFDPVTIDPSTWTCSIALTATDLSFDGLAPDQTAGCDQSPFALTAQNWKDKHVEVNLQIALDGGVDEYGVFWEGRRKQEPIATTIGRQFWDQLSEQCSIKDPCAPDINCERIGSYTGLALGRLGRPLKLPWVVLVSDAVKNLNLQLRNTFDQVLNAINSLALDAFYIDEFSPAKDPDTDIKDNLAGLGSILTILGGIIPVAGQTLDVAGTITSGIGGFIANAAPPDPLAAQKTFATNVLAYYEGLRDGLERFTTQLFAGAQISGPAGSFDLFALMKEGVWVGPDALTDVSQLNRDIRTEVTARSIDAIWKTWPSNKMWVLFTDLQDHEDHKKCLQGNPILP